MLAALPLLLGTSCSDEPRPGVPQECARNGVCNDGIFCNGEERCQDGKCVAGEPVDCDDRLACTADSCDETRWACEHAAPDADSDGHADSNCKDARSRPLGDDCDDADASRHPGADEICDSSQLDEDCDPSTVGERDADGDGATSASCCNASSHERQCGTDCDDSNPAIGPDTLEVCDGLDNDCDGQIDEDVQVLLYRDEDGDHYGAGDVALHSCAKVEGYADDDGDCDDDDPAIHPGAPESCETPAVDRDCNGKKNDLPGGCACKTGSERACPLPGPCSAGVLSCVDEVWSAACSIAPSPEACNGLDDDCNGLVDDEVTVDCYEDEDGDGYPTPGAASKSVCPSDEQADGCPKGFTHRAPSGTNGDCAPKDAKVSPGAQEVCNGKDDDCDGDVDEGLPVAERFLDADGDGHPGTSVQRCATDPSSYDVADDCMDDNPLVYPGQAGVFANPACSRGSVPCLAGDADWRCKLAGSNACDATLAPAHWDYDCDGDTTGEPLVNAPCVVADTCGDGCGPSGFRSLQSGAPGCGTTQAYQVCRCLGAQGGGCIEMTEQHAYPCH